MRLPTLLLACFLMLTGELYATPVKLNYIPSALPDLTSPDLSDVQWRRLGQKRELTLALYGTERPPLFRIDWTHRLTGYLPDVVWSSARSLGLTLRILHYANSDAAYAALNAGEADAVFSPAGDEVPTDYGPDEIVTVAQAFPVEVTRRAGSSAVRGAQSNLSPGTSPGQRLAALEQGLVTRVRLPAGEAYYLTDRSYVNSLQITRLSPEPMTNYRIVFDRRQPFLSEALQAAVSHLRETPVGEILASRWDQDGLMRFLASSLNLTPEEKTWLRANPEITVAASDFNAPFFITDKNGNHGGIGPDLLSLVSLRTGLHFRYKDVRDSRELADALNAGEVLMTAPLVWSRERSRTMFATVPFMYTPVVMLTRPGKGEIRRATLVAGQDATDWFVRTHPQVSVTYTGNIALAMQQVSDGDTDVTLNTLISARFLGQGLYQGKLILTQQLPVPDAPIVFGVNRASPELLSILNKAIELVPQDMFTKILTHWQSTPGTSFDTWKVYRGEFYAAAAAAVSLIFFTAVWAAVLRRQVRRTQQAKALLRQEIAFRDRLINGPPRPVYVASPDGEMIHVNKAFSSYFSAELSPRLSLSLYDVRHPLYAVWQSSMQNPPGDGVPSEADFTLEQDIGNKRQIRHWIIRFQEDDGSTGGYIGGWQDVTEYLTLQSELLHARLQAEQASQTKSRFLTTMSHEIRTPLSAIIGLLELQVQEKRPDTELISVAHESSLSLLALIGDILDLARIESGKMKAEPRWHRLSAIARPVVQAFSGLARQKGLRLTLMLPEEETEVFTDDTRLRQILANLTGNAVKFTQEGDVSVAISFPPDRPGWLMIEVKDTGPGISEEDQVRLFSPFEQADPSVSGGSGLGLAISRELATLMGGTLQLESTLGYGSLFTLALPVNRRAIEPESSVTYTEIPHRTGLNVLVVDDHPANRLLITRQLAILGHHASEAVDGRAGLEAWQRLQPDVILTDCSMPEMDGPQMARAIRHTDETTAIIGITANAQESERERCLAAGMNACLFRPVRLAQLASTLDSFAPSTLSVVETLDKWMDLAALEAFMPDSPDAVREFIETTITETRQDLRQMRNEVMQEDMTAAGRTLHRISGTLRVAGIRKLSEQFAFIEELVAMEEEKAYLLQQIADAEAMLENFSAAVRDSTRLKNEKYSRTPE